MKKLTFAFTCLLLTPFATALAERTTSTHSSTTTTDAHGADVTTEKSRSLETTGDGTVIEDSQVKTTLDPKGLNNKLAADTTHERIDQKNGDYEDTTVTKHADGTYEQETVKKETKNHWLDKGKTSTTTHATTLDPKGLGNKTTTGETATVETNPDGSKSKTVTETLNGKTLSEIEITNQ
jgi:hypothetical protein